MSIIGCLFHSNFLVVIDILEVDNSWRFNLIILKSVVNLDTQASISFRIGEVAFCNSLRFSISEQRIFLKIEVCNSYQDLNFWLKDVNITPWDYKTNFKNRLKLLLHCEF